jgi:GT2 family glycosyltransferase
MDNKMNETAPLVQAVIVTWNKKEDVVRLLEGLKDIHYPPDRLSVLVVDNHSSDGTAGVIEKKFPQVILIKNPENLGGAGGFNAGMRWSLEHRPDAKYLWLLDNDVQVDGNALTALVSVMEQHPRAAICGSRIMNLDHMGELIEVGAFIDYDFGDIKQNRPIINRANTVFKVDYVAACSLLVRKKCVEKMGLWHERFFIYWDDMEWGARFNAAGYEVLASNASVVYHPSWLGRTADNSAIWRNYYRVRNGLWFFSHYTSRLRRLPLLTRIIIRFMMYAANANLNSQPALSQAFIQGIGDFFQNSYGKKAFTMPPHHMDDYIEKEKTGAVCVFVADHNTVSDAGLFIQDLIKKNPGIKVWALVPKAGAQAMTAAGCETVIYERLSNGKISWLDKMRIMKILAAKPWDFMITSHAVPKMGAVWGRNIARVHFDKKTCISIEKMDVKALARIPFITLGYLWSLWVQRPGGTGL